MPRNKWCGREASSRCAEAPGDFARHEKRNGGKHDDNWPDWYARYIVHEQTGEALPA